MYHFNLHFQASWAFWNLMDQELQQKIHEKNAAQGLRWGHLMGRGRLHTRDSGSQGKLPRFKTSSHSEDQGGI